MAENILKYEASAGSGKTYQLTFEFLRRLLLLFRLVSKSNVLLSDETARLLGSVLAITFTNKAANEMKERILQRLKQFALTPVGKLLDKEPADFLEKLAAAVAIPRERIQVMAGQILEILLASFDEFNVKTIDSLMSSIIKVIAPDLNLPADFEIALDIGPELQEATRLFLDREISRAWPEVEALLRDLQSTEGLRLWRLDEKIVAVIIQLFHLVLRQDTEPQPVDSASLGRQKDAHWQRLAEELRQLYPIMTEAPQQKGRCAHLNGGLVREGLLQTLAKMASADGRAGPERLLDEAISGTFFSKTSAEPFLRKGCPEEYRRRFSAAFANTRSALADYLFTLSLFKVSHFQNFFIRFWGWWQQGRKRIFVEEFSKKIHSRLVDWQQNAFPYIYLKLSDRFWHFLFDEFQDTSELQFKALATLVDEVLASRQQASLFIVGDPKQAIYRWRGGNAALMEESELKKELPTIAHLAPEGFTRTLEENWRSSPAVIEFNNRFWDAAAISRITENEYLAAAIGRNFARSQQRIPKGSTRAEGYVEITIRSPEEGQSEEEERPDLDDLLMSELLKQVQRAAASGFDYSQMAILTRKNSGCRRIVRALLDNQPAIDCFADQFLSLSSHPLIQEIIAFLRFLEFPPDDLSFYSFIRGQIFYQAAQPLESAELATFTDDFLLSGRGRPWRRPLYKLFQQACPVLWSRLIESFFQSVGFLPAYDLLSDMSQIFRFFEHFPDSASYFLTLADLLHGLEKKNINSLASFLQHWRELDESPNPPTIAMPETGSGVRVMTMHQAKGLEFPVVIVPIGHSRERHDLPIVFHQGRVHHLNRKSAAIQPQLGEMYQAEIEKSTIDELNLLYVAFTRAREWLLVPVVRRRPRSSPKDGELKRFSDFTHIIARHPLTRPEADKPDGKFCLGTPKPSKSDDQEHVPPPKELRPQSKRILSRDWQKEFLVFADTPSPRREEKKAMDRGERMHRLLARIGQLADPLQAEALVSRLAVEEGLTPAEAGLIGRFICQERVWPFFHAGGMEILCEKEIALAAPLGSEYRRIDRIMVSAAELTLVDFKTGQEKNDGHLRQIKEYAAALRPMFPGRRCRSFLLYIDLGDVCEVPC